jgi:hypothetical protein
MNKSILIALISLIHLSLWAQQPKDTLNTEVINVVKPYAPKISDAFKIKENPQNIDQQIEKQYIDYQINSVPVASTFTPSKGKAKSVNRTKREVLYDNYFSVGFGNYTTPLVEAYLRSFPDRNSELGALIKHHSSQGGINEVILDDSFYDTAVDVYYKSTSRDLDWKINLNAQHRLLHWYGLPDLIGFNNEMLDTIKANQTYFNFGIGTEIKYYNSYFKGVKASLNRVSDSYKSGEIQARLQPVIELPISTEYINFEFDINFLNGKFDRDYTIDNAITYSFLNLGLSPNFEVLREYFSLNLGAKLYYAQDLDASDGAFKAYPNIDISYQIIDEIFTVYGGVTGGLHYNTYLKKSKENPFLSPNFNSNPTDEKYKAYAGLKGKFASNMSYLFKASYKDERDKSLFLLNRIKTDGATAVNESYELGNSFGVVYDDVKTFGIHGELVFDFSKEFTFGGSVDYATYAMQDQVAAWNLPNIKASLFTDYQTGKLTGNAKLFFIGTRKDVELPLSITARGIRSIVADNTITNDSYIDLNAGISYSFSNRLSAFAKAHNLLGSNYQRFANYKVQGIQVLAGITFKFDM